MNKLVITYMDNLLVTLIVEDGQVVAIHPESLETGPALGSIYVGRVQNIVDNINAAFIEIQPGINCFMPLSQTEHAIYVTKSKSDKLKIGDELLVQISKEAMKTKLPSVTTDLNISGSYFVFTLRNKKISYSKKYTISEQEMMKDYMKQHTLSSDYGIVCRTNAPSATSDALNVDFEEHRMLMDNIINHGKQRTCFSLLYHKDHVYIQQINSLYGNDITEVITDIPDVYNDVLLHLESQIIDVSSIKLYTDSYSLANLYSFTKLKEQFLNRKIWLKSGGYLIFDYTEACIVIDVNSGKNIKGHNKSNLINALNQEAALMIAKHLRLRNLSGICIIDFIDMKEASDQQELMQVLRKAVKKDPIPTKVIDLTQLNLVELTRQKINQPLHELFIGNVLTDQ